MVSISASNDAKPVPTNTARPCQAPSLALTPSAESIYLRPTGFNQPKDPHLHEPPAHAIHACTCSA